MKLKAVFGFLGASCVPVPAGRTPSVSAEYLSRVRPLRPAAGHCSGEVHAAAEWVNRGVLRCEL